MGRRGLSAKTIKIRNAIADVLSAEHPMTLRQVYYQLVSCQVVPNSLRSYQAVGRSLVDMRKAGEVPWEWVEDRLRRPRQVGMWADVADFADTAVRAYRRDVWADQDELVEAWVEKDALSGIFEDVLRPYGVTLNVGRGYDGWDSVHNAAERYLSEKPVTVLYFGDFDPTGVDISRSLAERLAFFESRPTLVRVALNKDDVERYQLPFDFGKASDSRHARFVARFGDMAVELDALPVGVLRERIRSEVESRMDLAALARIRDLEEGERAAIAAALKHLGEQEG